MRLRQGRQVLPARLAAGTGVPLLPLLQVHRAADERDTFGGGRGHLETGQLDGNPAPGQAAERRPEETEEASLRAQPADQAAVAPAAQSHPGPDCQLGGQRHHHQLIRTGHGGEAQGHV